MAKAKSADKQEAKAPITRQNSRPIGWWLQKVWRPEWLESEIPKEELPSYLKVKEKRAQKELFGA